MLLCLSAEWSQCCPYSSCLTYPLWPVSIILNLHLPVTFVNPDDPWWLLVGGLEWSTSLTEGGEPWSSSATSAPGRGGAQGREPALGRGSPSSTELQDPSRNRRAHPNWAILGNNIELCLCAFDCACSFLDTVRHRNRLHVRLSAFAVELEPVNCCSLFRMIQGRHVHVHTTQPLYKVSNSWLIMCLSSYEVVDLFSLLHVMTITNILNLYCIYDLFCGYLQHMQQ